MSEGGGGYGDPPKQTQWKKGQSGNPKGRPKGTPNLRTTVINVSKKRTELSINGKQSKRSALEAQVEMTMWRGLQGKGSSEAMMYGLYRDYLPLDEEVGSQGLSEEDRAILKNHIALAKLLAETEAAAQPPKKPSAASKADKPEAPNDK